MAGDEVRIDRLQGFREFAGGMDQVRKSFERVAQRHIDLVPPAETFPLANMSAALGELQRTNNAAVARLAEYVTHADRGLSGLSFVSMYIAKNFTGTDAASAAQMAEVDRLGTEAQGHVPPVPDGTPPIDQRFLGEPETIDQRRQGNGQQPEPPQPAQAR